LVDRWIEQPLDLTALIDYLRENGVKPKDIVIIEHEER
jgi:hypothetical protein